MNVAALTARTDAKLRYARLHLEELKASPQPLNGDDFERAHQESFLFHLLGTRDCFLVELAARHGHPLGPKDRVSNLRAYLQKKKVTIASINEISDLGDAPGSWLKVASDMRNIGTHDRGVSRAFSVDLSGKEPPAVKLRDPATGNLTTHYLEEFEHWHQYMFDLISRLRQSAP